MCYASMHCITEGDGTEYKPLFLSDDRGVVSLQYRGVLMILHVGVWACMVVFMRLQLHVIACVRLCLSTLFGVQTHKENIVTGKY